MNQRIKKKLKKRFGYFHYKDYKNERKRLGLKKSDPFIHFSHIRPTFKQITEILRTVKPSPALLYLTGADRYFGFPDFSGRSGTSVGKVRHVSNHLLRIPLRGQIPNEEMVNSTVVNVQIIKSRSINQPERRQIII